MTEQTSSDLYEVDTDSYLDAIGEDLPIDCDTLHVDRRGYSSVVTESLEPDYLANQLLIFSAEQAVASMRMAEYSFLPELVDTVYEESEMVEYASPEHPVELDVLIDEQNEELKATAVVDANKTVASMKDAIDTREAVRDIGPSELQDPEYVEELVEEAQAATAAFGDLDDITVAEDAGSVTFPRFSYNTGYEAGHVFGEGNRFAIITLGEDVPWKSMVPFDVYDLRYDAGATLEKLYREEQITVKDEALTARLKDIAQNSVEAQGVADPSGFALWHAVMAHSDALPEEYWALQGLAKEDVRDMRISDEAEARRVLYLKPQTEEAAGVLEDLDRMIADGHYPDGEQVPRHRAVPDIIDSARTDENDSKQNIPLENWKLIKNAYSTSDSSSSGRTMEKFLTDEVVERYMGSRKK